MKFPWFLALYQYLEGGAYPLDCDRVTKQRIRRHANRFEIHLDHLVEKGSACEVLHEGNERSILEQLHAEGHFGPRKLAERIQESFVCDNVQAKARLLVKECTTCQFRARRRIARLNLMRLMETLEMPFTLVGCDAIGPLEVTEQGNKYILTAIDHLMRWPIVKAVKDITEKTTMDFLYSELVVPYGVPKYLLTDRGSNFVSEYTVSFLKAIGCRNVPTTAYRPQTNGLCERLNQTLAFTLAKLARDKDDVYQWDRYLDKTLLALRTLKNEATGQIPAFLLFGYKMKTPATWSAPIHGYVEGDYEEDVAKRIEFIHEDLKRIREEARQRSDARKLVAKKYYDQTVYPRAPFQIGDLILMKDMTPRTKFSDKWIGPFVVVKVNAHSGTYHLEGARNQQQLKGAVNGDVLVPYHESTKMVPEVQPAYKRFKAWISQRNPHMASA